MSIVTDKVSERLKKHEEPLRKPLTISYKMEHIKNLDTLAKVISQQSGQTTTRNMLIEDAVDSFIKETTLFLEEQGIELDIEDDNDFDTVIYPAQMNDDYQRAFFDDHEWRYVRVGKKRIDKIKYVALYVGAPQSSVSHYAKVAPNGFVYDKREKKYKIKLAGDPIELPRPIPLGSTPSQAVRTLKYTTLAKLFTANEFCELYE
ncbi:MAG: hypothetical protein HFF09_02600 [Oscillospiraceae bacterium]|nr:hypothetical protein [Oscillospiraceae bacterium]